MHALGLVGGAVSGQRTEHSDAAIRQTFSKVG